MSVPRASSPLATFAKISRSHSPLRVSVARTTETGVGSPISLPEDKLRESLGGRRKRAAPSFTRGLVMRRSRPSGIGAASETLGWSGENTQRSSSTTTMVQSILQTWCRGSWRRLAVRREAVFAFSLNAQWKASSSLRRSSKWMRSDRCSKYCHRTYTSGAPLASS